MNAARIFLAISTIVIYVMTLVAVFGHGINWPAIAVNDLLALNWRSQFNTDFLIYLLLVASWISWREGPTARGYMFGALNVVMGGMFLFPYILHAVYRAKGEPRAVLLGVHA